MRSYELVRNDDDVIDQRELIENIVSMAIIAAPIRESIRQVQYQAYIQDRFESWDIVQRNLPLTLPLPNPPISFLPGCSVMVDTNTIYARTLDSYYPLLLHAYSRLFNLPERHKTVKECAQADYQHEVQHHRIARQYGAILRSFSIEFFKDSDGVLCTQAGVMHGGIISIEGYVRYTLANLDDPSTGDLADVGLTPDHYAFLRESKIHPVLFALKPWYEAGKLPWPDASEFYMP